MSNLNIDSKVKGSLMGMSMSRQTDSSTAASVDTLISLGEDSVISRIAETEDDSAENTGTIEPTTIDTIAFRGEGQFDIPRPTPHALALLFAYAFNGSYVSPVSGPDSLYRHEFWHTKNPQHPHYFTAVERRGGGTGVGAPASFKQHIGASVGGIQTTFTRGETPTVNGTIVGTGRMTNAIETEEFNHDFTTNGDDIVIPSGRKVEPQADEAEAATRINVWCDPDNLLEDMNGDNRGVFSRRLAVASYNSLTDTISLVPGHGVTDIKAVRVTFEADTSHHAWKDLSGLSVPDEFILKATNIRILYPRKFSVPIPGTWDPFLGDPLQQGGYVPGCELRTLDWNYTANHAAEPCWRAEEFQESLYAQEVTRGDLTQSLTIERDIVDWLYETHLEKGTPFGVEVNAIGPIAPGGSTDSHRLGVWMYWPWCQVEAREDNVTDGNTSETVTVRPLVRPGMNGPSNAPDPSVLVCIQNEQVGYNVLT